MEIQDIDYVYDNYYEERTQHVKNLLTLDQ